jgi:hypothetical protein
MANKSSIFWDVTLHSRLKANRCFGGASAGFNTLHGDKSYKAELFITTTVTTLNATKLLLLYWTLANISGGLIYNLHIKLKNENDWWAVVQLKYTEKTFLN